MRAVLLALAFQFAFSTYSLPLGNQEDPYLAFAETMPAPVGGMRSIYAKIKYPESARHKSIEGNIYALALINEEGTVDDVKIIKGLESNCDKEAAAAISSSKFSPGKQEGKAVKVKLTLKIEFKLT